MGVDVGSVRVGLALSDPDGILAHPVATVAPEDTDAVDRLVVEHAVSRVYVGLPRTLRGDEGAAAQAARGYARALASRVAPVPVRLVDERLTTVVAHRQLGGSGVRERGRRSIVDQAAAVLILQGALDLESSSGRPAGELLTPGRKPRHGRHRKEHG
jgi:putative Holliday junction resolvase